MSGFIRAVWVITRKDLLVEARTREILFTTVFFALACVLVFAFGFVREVEALRAKVLIQGATTDNAVVLDDHGVVGNALRCADEFVRHKILDLIGDLSRHLRREIRL